MVSKVVVIDSADNKEEPKETLVFTSEIEDFYGAGSLINLMEKVCELTNEQMIEFADKRFKGHGLKKGTKKDDIADKIRSLVDTEYVKHLDEKVSEDNE